MTIILTSTTKVITLNGIPCRVWEGETKSGIPMHAYIPRVAVHKDLDCSQFDQELQECQPPSFEVDAIPLRLLI